MTLHKSLGGPHSLISELSATSLIFERQNSGEAFRTCYLIIIIVDRDLRLEGLCILNVGYVGTGCCKNIRKI